MKSLSKSRLILLGLGVAVLSVAVGFRIYRDPPGQTADTKFDTKVARPAYAGEHPRVLFDEAHRNIHRANGLYKPFVDLLINDGYRVFPNKEILSPRVLEGYRILV